jgi:DNA-binding CsgD family transcriptional regulator
MYLTAREISLISDIFATLSSALHEDEMRRLLGEKMLDLLQADYLVSHIWDTEKKAFVGRVALNMSEKKLSEYERHPRFHYMTAPLPEGGKQVAPSMESGLQLEPVSEPLRLIGLHWGMDVFARLGNENIGDLRIWRRRERDNFSSHEFALAELVRPSFTSALARTRSEIRTIHAELPDTPAVSEHALKALSPREQEVVSLIVEGLLDKQIAERLGISYTTVRTHVDRTFQKMGVSNRATLIRLARKLDS